MSNSALEKPMENIRTNNDIKLVPKEKRRNCVVPQPNCKSTRWFSENLLAIEMAKNQVTMNKLV